MKNNGYRILHMYNNNERKVKMGKLKGLVEDFIQVIAEDEQYAHKDWSWSNLPSIETIIEVLDRHERRSNDNTRNSR